MTIPRFSNAIGNIDDDLIKAAAECKRKKRNTWIKWGAMAACLSLCAVLSIIGLHKSSVSSYKTYVIDTGNTETNIIPAEPNKTTLYYSSFDDFYKELSNDNYSNNFNECGKHFNSLLRMSCKNNDYLYEPAYNGERVELKSLNGNSIVLFSQEKFNLPWIWYCCEIDGKKLVIEICYLDDVDEIEISDDASYSDISQCLSSSYATAKTFNEKDRKVYKSIIEKNIILFDNTEVSASVFDYNEDNYWHRKNYRFRYKNILVSAWNWDEESYDYINDDFMSALSFI